MSKRNSHLERWIGEEEEGETEFRLSACVRGRGMLRQTELDASTILLWQRVGSGCSCVWRLCTLDLGFTLCSFYAVASKRISSIGIGV